MINQDTNTAQQRIIEEIGVIENATEETASEINHEEFADQFLSRILKDQSPSQNTSKASSQNLPTNPQTEGQCWHFLTSCKTKLSVDFYAGKQRLKAKRFAFEFFKKERVPANLFVISKCGNLQCINPEHQAIGDRKEARRILHTRCWPYKKGWKQKPEVIEIIRKAHTGRKTSSEVKERLRQVNLGKKHTEETKRKMSQNRVGIGVPEAARKKIAISKQGGKNWNTKLTVKDILKIRRLAEGEKSRGKRTKRGELTIAEIAEMFQISTVHVINIRDKKVWKHVNPEGKKA